MTEEEKDAYIKKLLTSNIDQHNKISFLSTKVHDLQKQNGELIDQVADLKEDVNKVAFENGELKAQIEKMKCCYNCSKWYDGECEESPKSKTFFCADFKCDNWEIADD